MKVIGIDPAPSKKSVIYDGIEFRKVDAHKLRSFIKELAKEPKVLVGWDAPLGAATDKDEFDLYSRKIERFFNNQRKGLGIPKGISTLGYAGCPHWTISQYVLGLPLLNEELQRRGALHYLNHNDELIEHSHCVVETHPALSLYILLRHRLEEDPLFSKGSWQYKGNIPKKEKNARIDRILNALNEHETAKKHMGFLSHKELDDDSLDALVCYIVTSMFVHEPGSAVIYGDERRGSFLLPYDAAYYEAFEKFE